MQEARHVSTSVRLSFGRHALVRLAASSAIVVAVLAVAGPSWAGPLTGC